MAKVAEPRWMRIDTGDHSSGVLVIGRCTHGKLVPAQDLHVNHRRAVDFWDLLDYQKAHLSIFPLAKGSCVLGN